MSATIKVFPAGSEEYQKLAAVAEALTKKSPKGYRYEVGETYFDYGQDWSWTTILCEGGIFGGYQALCPRDQEEIILGNHTPEEMADRVLASRFCPDRIEKEA